MFTLFLLMFMCFGCFGGYVHNENIIDVHINQKQKEAVIVTQNNYDKTINFLALSELASVHTFNAIIEYAQALNTPFSPTQGTSYNFSVDSGINCEFVSATSLSNSNFMANKTTMNNEISSVDVFYGTNGSSNGHLIYYITLDIYTTFVTNNYFTRIYYYYYAETIDSPVISYVYNYTASGYSFSNTYMCVMTSDDVTVWNNILFAWGIRDKVSEDSYNQGIETGKSIGEQIGYEKGIEYAESINSTAFTIFQGIIEVGLLPVNVFLQIFNFELFGINVSGIISALLSVSIAIIIIRFLLGGKNNDK